MHEISQKLIRIVAIYARVSTARQEEEGTIETQLSAVREFAAKNGYSIAKRYVDDGWSGDLLARPGLDQLRGDAKARIWDAVLIYDPDRLARRYSFQELVMDEFRELGIETLFVTVPPSKNSEDRLLYGVRGVFAEYERIKIAERFRLGKIRKAKEGHILTTEGPYGYTFILKRGKPGDADFRQGHYVFNESEARVVRQIFEWVANEGMTIRKVVKRLEEAGIPPRRSKRGVWNASTLGTLLRNRTYIGEGHFASSYAVVPERPHKKDGYRRVKKTSRRMRPREEWIIIPTLAIFADESGKRLFDRAQRQLEINFKLAQRNKKNQYLLSGKIQCVCNRNRTGEGVGGGKHIYYRCTNRIYSYPLPPTCKEGGINAKVADKLVWEKIAELMRSEELMLEQATRWMSRGLGEATAAAVDTAALREEVAKLKKQEERYAVAYGEGLFSMDRLKELVGPLKARIASLEAQIAEVHAARDRIEAPVPPTHTDIQAFAARASRALESLNFEEKRAIVLNIVDRIVGTQKELRVHGHIPVGQENHVESQTSNRDRADTIRHGFGRAGGRSFPFELTIKLPPPLQRGVDYGFRPGQIAP
jgi:site-specific DNA recombinase